MKRFVQTSSLVLGLAAMILAIPAEGSVNKSITVDDGATSSGESSVNGSITVGKNATVNGSLNTVNGKIRIGDDSNIEDANTVNGSIKIGENVRAERLETVNGSIGIDERSTVDGDVSAVNGGISLSEGSSVSKDLSNVNGDIELRGAQVGGDISTTGGDIELFDGAVVQGNLIVEKPGGMFWNRGKSRTPKIVIGPGCRVDGVIRVERKVKLYISESAQVGGVDGEMSMDDSIRFSGDRP